MLILWPVITDKKVRCRNAGVQAEGQLSLSVHFAIWTLLI